MLGGTVSWGSITDRHSTAMLPGFLEVSWMPVNLSLLPLMPRAICDKWEEGIHYFLQAQRKRSYSASCGDSKPTHDKFYPSNTLGSQVSAPGHVWGGKLSLVCLCLRSSLFGKSLNSSRKPFPASRGEDSLWWKENIKGQWIMISW